MTDDCFESTVGSCVGAGVGAGAIDAGVVDAEAAAAAKALLERENNLLLSFEWDSLAGWLPNPATDTNKYARGKLVLCAGSARYPGAACLAAIASQRAGAGYTEVVTEAPAVPIVQAAGYSLVVRAADDRCASDMPAAQENRPVAVAVGCGFDAADPASERRVCTVLRAAQCPALVDGGGLACLSRLEARMLLEDRASKGFATVITPHAGEAARLARTFGIGTESPIIEAHELARQLHAVVVLKGPNTYIADGEDVIEMPFGTPALAKAGTGDVLAGVIGALLAQGIAPMRACLLGTALHARAGIAAAADLSDIAVTAEDVIDYLPQAILDMKE